MKSISLTASIGVASLTDENAVHGKLLKETDQALYLAKSKGRNCVIASSELMESAITE
ncbi:MAG: diguanylate cyclase [Anaerolineaceae bacterium]|nr:diguanylate cyclase [Anaerolineaceae bacterium]